MDRRRNYAMNFKIKYVIGCAMALAVWAAVYLNCALKKHRDYDW